MKDGIDIRAACALITSFATSALVILKAITRTLARLRKGGAGEQALARHLTEAISLGYEVVYTQPAGRIWG